MKYTTINIQGNLISEEILHKLESGEAQGQKSSDFGFDPGSNLRSEIEYAWSRIKLDWKHFSDKSQNLPASDPYGTTLSRKWMEQFLSSIGFDLSKTKAGLQGDNKQSYTISHIAENLSQLPVHIVGPIEPSNPDKNTLDIKTSGGTSRLSPHATMQEYLNVTEHLYGIAANGLFLRLIRDSGRLIKLTYVEFDLKRMLDEDKYSEFTLLYRLLHATRFPRTQTEADQCFLEKYYQDSIETGNRIRDGLSLAVKESLLALGNGFLQHESNNALREKIQSGQLSSKEYYRQLLRIIYRFLFLMVTEERDLVYDPEDKRETTQRFKKVYLQFYSIARLRKLSTNRYVYESQFNDLWQGLVQTFQLFEAGGKGKKIGIQPLDGDLFNSRAIQDLEECLISNKLLLECVRNMNEFRDEKKNLVNINYRSLDVEELGSVYEGLLELHPVIENIEASNSTHINFTFHEGTDRKTTGSYYTRPELVNELIKSALIPVIEERLNDAERMASGEWHLVNSEWKSANGQWIQSKFKQLILNISLENEKLSGIASLAKRDRINGDDLPINQLLSQRRIVWLDFSDSKIFNFSSREHSRGLGQKQQQGIQQLSADSQWKFEGIGNSLDRSRENQTLQHGQHTSFADPNGNTGQTNTLFTKIHLSEKHLTIIWKQIPVSTRYSLLANHQLLKLKVCDAAAGSGHMLLAAARTIAWYLARVQSGEENPAPSVYRSCLREVIQHCIYAVDFNPDAVELCKLALWLEGHNSGKPLSFLDHKIRNGNSLVGVSDLSVLQKGIPDDAFNPVTGDDKKVCQELKKENAKYNKTKQTTLDFDQSGKIDTTAITGDYKELENIRQDDVEGVKQVKTKFDKLRSNNAWFNDWRACNLWTAAFFWNYTEENKQAAPNSERLAKFLQNPAAAYGPMIGKADALSMEHKFFHWPLEFPDVFEQGGFDVMLGNPPWERIKLQQQEFFATRDAAIANAPNAAARNRLINALPQTNPALFNEYETAVHTADASGKFLRGSGRCQLTAVGDINTYSIFSELTSILVNKKGRTGIIVPTGIATDDSNKAFFGAMVESNRLVSLFDFENKESIFPSVDRSYKFCLFTISGSDLGNFKANYGFFLSNVEHLKDMRRIFSLTKTDFLKLNPNTKTCPVFRTNIDSQLLNKIYNNSEILVNYLEERNPFNVKFLRMFDMGNDSDKFLLEEDLLKINSIQNGPVFKDVTTEYFRLYEGKMVFCYDHRYASVVFNPNNNSRSSQPERTPESKYLLSNYFVRSLNFISKEFIYDKIKDYPKKYFLGFRKVTSQNNDRTVISSIIPISAVGDSFPLIILNNERHIYPIFFSNLSSIIVEYIVRQKVGGPNINFFHLEQIPFLNINDYSSNQKNSIIKSNLELSYTSWDIKAFADDVWKEAGESEKVKVKSEKYGELSELQLAIVQQWEANHAATGGHEWAPPEWCEEYGWEMVNGEWQMVNSENPLATHHSPFATKCPLPPFKWDEERRAVLKAELDAIYAKLYGLSTEELRYILDPQDVYGPDFPGETFRVLKEKEIKQFGEYRTRRLVLEAWERLNKNES